MKYQDYSVVIPEGQEVAGGYVEMRHKTRYTLHLGSKKNVRSDARVEIDGNHVGTWRVNPNSLIRLERPANDDGHFTFYVLGTTEASKVALVSNDQIGLVSVSFRPERVVPKRSIAPVPEEDSEIAFLRRRAGGTGLSGHSQQVFVDAAPIVYDETARVTIHLRLVETDDNEPRPLRSVAMETPIPPAVNGR